MKKKRWTILICIILVLVGIVAGLYMLGEKHKISYEAWEETCEYVNTHYRCGYYDCSKRGYRKNYNLCRDEFISITE